MHIQSPTEEEERTIQCVGGEIGKDVGIRSLMRWWCLCGNGWIGRLGSDSVCLFVCVCECEELAGCAFARVCVCVCVE
jgi:hypothetical protein